MKAQLRIAQKIIALKKAYAKAPESKKAAIRAKILAKKESLSMAREHAKEVTRGVDSKKVLLKINLPLLNILRELLL